MTRDEVIHFHHQAGWPIEGEDHLRWLCGVFQDSPSEKPEEWAGRELIHRLKKQYSPLMSALAAWRKYGN